MTSETEHPESSLYRPRRRWWRDLLLGCLIFVCGGLVGSGLTLHRIRVAGPDLLQRQLLNMPARVTERLTKNMKLSKEQQVQVREILERGQKDLKAVRRSVLPQVEVTLEKVRTDVSAVLTEKQRQQWNHRFDLLRDRWFPKSTEPEVDAGKGSAAAPNP